MAKRFLIAAGLVGIIGLAGMSFSGLAQQSPEKPTSTVQKPVSANLSLTEFDQDLLMSMVTQSPGFAIQDKAEALKIAWTLQTKILARTSMLGIVGCGTSPRSKPTDTRISRRNYTKISTLDLANTSGTDKPRPAFVLMKSGGAVSVRTASLPCVSQK